MRGPLGILLGALVLLSACSSGGTTARNAASASPSSSTSPSPSPTSGCLTAISALANGKDDLVVALNEASAKFDSARSDGAKATALRDGASMAMGVEDNIKVVAVPTSLDSAKAQLLDAARDRIRGMRDVASSYSANANSVGLKGSGLEKKGNRLLDSVAEELGAAPCS